MRRTIDGMKTALPVGIAALAMAAIVAQTASAGADAATASQPPRVVMAVEVSPDPVEPLHRVTVATTFRASSDLPETLEAELEMVSAADGSSVLSTSQSGFSIPSGDARAVYWLWRVPADTDPGEYTLHLKLVGVDSGTVYGEQDLQEKLSVSAR